MGLFSNLFGKKDEPSRVRSRENQPDVVDVSDQNERMNAAMKEAQNTINIFTGFLQNPKPGQNYFSVKVKIVDGPKVEHLWLINPSFDAEGNLFGVVGNEPIDVKSVQFNQKVGIDSENISDWMILENGKLIGGYTIRAIRAGLSGAALEQFDRGLGGMKL